MLALIVIAVTALTLAMLLAAVRVADRGGLRSAPRDKPAGRLHDPVATDKTSEPTLVARETDHRDEGV